MTQFPTALDTFTNPTGTTNQATLSHSAQHANSNDSIAALQAKVGVNSSANANTLDYKVTWLMSLLSDPNGNCRIKSSELQIWDAGLNAYRPITCVNGVLGVGATVAT
jgi:hypothetical protein